ncbi:hypothetical protein GDO81_024414 [Engystomops pustulosus]|uniref:Uncharacterized protein n=1 Tax=Engystomops pustulosus TaxID=76066 RepID=A0AAV6ZAL7_ENGPU|nr:hypothetical protein GDO81_029999 [Engystomops pustulosus]KAG8543531.1 hypothetical protein GDO81_024414 [Engystomops pustulosus]
MKPTLRAKRSSSSSARSGSLQRAMEKPKENYKRHLVTVLSRAQATSRHLWALDVLTREAARGDGFPLIAAEAARLSHYSPRRAITGPEICSALRTLHPARAAK